MTTTASRRTRPSRHRAAHEDVWLRGYATAISTVIRWGIVADGDVIMMLVQAGVTLQALEKSGCADFDLRPIRKALLSRVEDCP